MQVGDVVRASFGRGVHTFKVHVVVYAIVRDRATVLARDGTLYGPTRRSSLQMVDDLEQVERILWQGVLHDRQLRDRGQDVPRADPPDPPALDGDNGVAADDGVAADNGVVDNVVADNVADAPAAALPVVTVVADESFMCDLCGEDNATFACSGECHFCADCVTRYSETLFEGKAQSQVPLCAQKCGAVMPWKTMASAIDSDVKFARLFTHFADSRSVVVPVVHNTESLLDKVQDKALADLAETQTLKKPCCNTAMFDFQDCFAVKCNNCPSTFFCAWCMEHVSDNSADAHAHVRVCAQNALPGAVYGDYAVWEAHCRGKKRQRLDAVKGAIAHKMDKYLTTMMAVHYE